LALEGSPLRHSVMGDDVYLVPRGVDTVIGATTEHAGFDVRTEQPALDALRSAAIALCPSLGAAPVKRAWAGIRPATADLLPIPDGRNALSHRRTASRSAAPRPETVLVEGSCARRSAVPPPQATDAAARPPHGLRGGALPQRRRMLGAWRGHVHDPRRRVHAKL